MTDFNHRWQALVMAARQAPVHRGTLSDLHAARLAAQGLAYAHQQREAQEANVAWRGMALAASLFLACLIGSGGVVAIFYPAINSTDFAMQMSSVPSTAFIPSPPRPPALASLANDWSPTKVFHAVGEWFDSRSSVQENSP
jgi:hypothetical protein